MSESHHAMLRTQAIALAAALEPYRDAARALLREPADVAIRGQLRDQLRAMGEIASMLPALWVPWGAFAVLHFKLVSPRWRMSGVDTKGLFVVAAEHESALDDLQHHCMRWAGVQRGGADAQAPG